MSVVVLAAVTLAAAASLIVWCLTTSPTEPRPVTPPRLASVVILAVAQILAPVWPVTEGWAVTTYILLGVVMLCIVRSVGEQGGTWDERALVLLIGWLYVLGRLAPRWFRHMTEAKDRPRDRQYGS